MPIALAHSFVVIVLLSWPLVLVVVFFRTLILYNTLWNTHFHCYLGGQSVSNTLLWQPSDCTTICYD